MAMVRRFEVYLVSLAPTVGSEIRKTRPCVVISPNEMNRHINTVIVAPMTTTGKDYPTRAPLRFLSKRGFVVLDQIRTIDKTRLVKKIGDIDSRTRSLVLERLQELFAR
jgi:mRNA interferase MazF